MGKHSKESENNNAVKIIFIIIIVLAILFAIGYALYKYPIIANTKSLLEKNIKSDSLNTVSEVEAEVEVHEFELEQKTIEEQKLVLKSNSDFNKIIEFNFKDKIIDNIIIHEQFENEEEYAKKLENYKLQDSVNIIKNNDIDLTLEIERKNLGSDEGLSYEDIYNKYAIQIIGAYEIIK